jgi:hypothetical protein
MHLRSHFATALLAASLLAGPARADDGPARSEAGAPATVTLDVQIIAPSPAKGEVDKRLTRLSKRMSDFNFQSYRLLSEQPVVLGLDSREKLSLPGNRTLELRPRLFEKNGKLRVRLSLYGKSEAKLVDADYAIDPGGEILVGGPKHEDGTLMVYIRHARTQTPAGW